MRAVELGLGVLLYRLEDLVTPLKRNVDLPTLQHPPDRLLLVESIYRKCLAETGSALSHLD